jgi:hypothetical protein
MIWVKRLKAAGTRLPNLTEFKLSPYSQVRKVDIKRIGVKAISLRHISCDHPDFIIRLKQHKNMTEKKNSKGLHIS